MTARTRGWPVTLLVAGVLLGWAGFALTVAAVFVGPYGQPLLWTGVVLIGLALIGVVVGAATVFGRKRGATRGTLRREQK